MNEENDDETKRRRDDNDDDDHDAAAGALGVLPSARGKLKPEPRPRRREEHKPSKGHRLLLSGGGGGGGGPSPKVLAVTSTRTDMFVPGAGVRPFHFARVFSPEATQVAVYADAAKGSVLAALNGYNACLMCYGQTGSGKTHTLTGPPGALDALDADAVAVGNLPPSAGVVPRALAQVLSSAAPGGVTLTVTAQYVQIYREKVTCLIPGDDVTLRSCSSLGRPVVVVVVEEEEA